MVGLTKAAVQNLIFSVYRSNVIAIVLAITFTFASATFPLSTAVAATEPSPPFYEAYAQYLTEQERSMLQAAQTLEHEGTGLAINVQPITTAAQGEIVGIDIADAINQAIERYPDAQVSLVIPGIGSPQAAQAVLEQRLSEPGQGRDAKAGLLRFVVSGGACLVGVWVLPNAAFFEQILSHYNQTGSFFFEGIANHPALHSFVPSLLPVVGLAGLSGWMTYDFTRFIGMLEAGGAHLTRFFDALVSRSVVPFSRMVFGRGSNGEFYSTRLAQSAAITGGTLSIWAGVETFCYGVNVILQQIAGIAHESGSESLSRLLLVTAATTFFQGMGEIGIKNEYNPRIERVANVDPVAAQRIMSLRNNLTVGLSFAAVSIGIAIQRFVPHAIEVMIGLGFVNNSRILWSHIRELRAERATMVQQMRKHATRGLCNRLLTTPTVQPQS